MLSPQLCAVCAPSGRSADYSASTRWTWISHRHAVRVKANRLEHRAKPTVRTARRSKTNANGKGLALPLQAAQHVPRIRCVLGIPLT